MFFQKGINDKPGLLALAMESYIDANGKEDLRGWPFVVPGGRFNELYGNDTGLSLFVSISDGKQVGIVI